MIISDDIKYVGVNDREIDLFESQYEVKNGMSYNSYVIMDEKIAVMDTVDARFTEEWLNNLSAALGGRKPDYLIVQHMEPDHSSGIVHFMTRYPAAKLVSSQKSYKMMLQFFGNAFTDNQIAVGENDTLALGKHTLTFITAPMVHWPEVTVTYDSRDKVLFSADGFGKFGAVGTDEIWDDEARRYYIGIVGKYGVQVQALLKKASSLDIKMICPLHGPILTEEIPHCVKLYDIWSSYSPEKNGVVIAYTSIYGNTKKAVKLLEKVLKESGAEVKMFDLARCDMSEAVAEAFCYSKLVLATTTYNSDIFPFMKQFIDHLTERGYKNRLVGTVENGTWAPQASKIMRRLLENSKDISFTDANVKILSAVNETNEAEISALAKELCEN